MNIDPQLERRIREAFMAHEWLGAVPIEEAISGVIAYRSRLNVEDSAVFDAELLAGRHPSLIVETVEIASGRQSSLTQARRRSVARAS